jgi:hypothetical protein
MDLENEHQRRNRKPGDPDGTELRPARAGLWLYKLRDRHNEDILGRIPPGSRQRKLVAYALVDVTAGNANADLDAVRDLIRSSDHATAHSVYDVAAPHSPRERPGWNEALHLCQAGYADGIAAVSRHAISDRDNEYEHEVRDLGVHGWLFLLAHSEAAT